MANLNAGGWRSGPKDFKNIQHLGSVVDSVRGRVGVELALEEMVMDTHTKQFTVTTGPVGRR